MVQSTHTYKFVTFSQHLHDFVDSLRFPFQCVQFRVVIFDISAVVDKNENQWYHPKFKSKMPKKTLRETQI